MEQNEATAESTPVKGSAESMPGVVELIKQSKDIVMKRSSFFFMIAAVPALIKFVGEVAMVMNPLLGILFVVLSIVGSVVGIYAAIATIKGLADDSMNDWKAAYKKSKGMFWQFVWIAILVAIVVMIGFILLIIPGIYLSVALGFYIFFFVLEGSRGWDAARKSKELVKGYWWAVLGRWLAFGLIIAIVVGILGAIVAATGIALLATVLNLAIGIILTPLAMAYSYLIYKALKKVKKSDQPAKPSQPAGEEAGA